MSMLLQSIQSHATEAVRNGAGCWRNWPPTSKRGAMTGADCGLGVFVLGSENGEKTWRNNNNSTD